MNYFYQKGFTVIELLISIAVIGIITVIVVPQFTKIRENQVLKAAGEDVLSSLNKARSQTLASLDSSEYGVRFEANQVIIFKGTTYSAVSPDNVVVSVTSPASITNVTLGGVSGTTGNLYFNRIYGAPSTSGTITISTSSFTKTITISASGVFSVN
jgi:type IV fimbrial biogenesis protein FimT